MWETTKTKTKPKKNKITSFFRREGALLHEIDEEVIEDSIPIEKEAGYATQVAGRPVARSARLARTATLNPWTIM